MAENNVKLNVSVDANAAVRDPLFWLGLFVSKATLGRVDTGRWKKYLRVEDADG
ncbi:MULTISPECIES: hypothetical protein [unclassified Sulfitobacter]|jgi:hypothetical protein|uniref:hypothetical protein n=1 Tax=unclassified Sulfitobacter TaxID=196795 RepID=UPI000AF6644A|nr:MULTISPECIES: hypothetical protein [unclassified Sulfitobacter]